MANLAHCIVILFELCFIITLLIFLLNPFLQTLHMHILQETQTSAGTNEGVIGILRLEANAALFLNVGLLDTKG
jgi:hypothetical protein